MRAEQRTAFFSTHARRIPRRLALALIAWGVVVALGIGLMMRYGQTRGAPAAFVPAYVAAGRDVTDAPARRAGVPLLLVFAHPKCPCTRATIAELDRLLARVTVRPDTWVLFARPDGEQDGWERGELWESASRLPGVSVRSDANGALAARFGAATSGQVLLYDASGRLAFAGGITAARGHAGDNAGADAIAALLAGGGAAQRAAVAQTPVFGCALGNRAAGTNQTTVNAGTHVDLETDRSLTCHQ